MKFLQLLHIFVCFFGYLEAKKCVYDTNIVCTPFKYSGKEYVDECYNGWRGDQCIDPNTNDWEYCGECTGPINVILPTTEPEKAPVTNTPHTELETEKTPVEPKCVDGTNRVCTPFTYDGVEYTDCYNGWSSYQCIELGKTGWKYCGKCTGPPEVYTTTEAPLITTEVTEETTDAIEETTEAIEETTEAIEETTEAIKETTEAIEETTKAIEETTEAIEETTETTTEELDTTTERFITTEVDPITEIDPTTEVDTTTELEETEKQTTQRSTIEITTTDLKTTETIAKPTIKPTTERTSQRTTKINFVSKPVKTTTQKTTKHSSTNITINISEETSTEKAKGETTTGIIYTKILSPTDNDTPTIRTTISKNPSNEADIGGKTENDKSGFPTTEVVIGVIIAMAITLAFLYYRKKKNASEEKSKKDPSKTYELDNISAS